MATRFRNDTPVSPYSNVPFDKMTRSVQDRFDQQFPDTVYTPPSSWPAQHSSTMVSILGKLTNYPEVMSKNPTFKLSRLM